MPKKETAPQKPLIQVQIRHAKLRIEQIAERKALKEANVWTARDDAFDQRGGRSPLIEIWSVIAIW